MRFLHLRLMLVDRGIQSGSPSLVHFGTNSRLIAIVVLIQHYFQDSRFPRGLGTLGGLYHRSFASVQLVLVFSCYG